MFHARPCCRSGIGPYLRSLRMASFFRSDSLAISQTAEEWTASDRCTDLLYQSSCRLPFRTADQTGFNESLNVNVRFCWDLRKPFRPHAEALPIRIGSPALLVPALSRNPVSAGKTAMLFVQNDTASCREGRCKSVEIS